ncbi:MAG: S9 family peptidase [Bifidobacteriaceae bacterium]|jgi:oligopeptidase B|nr:S9 family peptidase [Bifidobacteriaceae bacterium]MCI1979536.1 S9 family peptidase [Bifidobacteriaceae bacterium]
MNYEYPFALKKPHERTLHGDTFVDNYEWLRDKDSTETQQFIAAENAYTEKRMKPLDGLRKTLFDELKSRIQETDMSVPTRMDGYWYFGRTVEGKQYGLQCRVPVTDVDDWNPPTVEAMSAPGSLPGEQVFFDANREAEGHDFFRVGAMDLSKDGSLMLYGTDTHGDERYDLRVRVIGSESRWGVEPGHDFDEVIEQVGGGACLSPDGRWVFYTKVDDAWRPYSVWRHRVGSPASEDTEAWREDDERFWVGVGMSFDEKHFVISTSSKTTSEVLQLPVEDPTGEFQPIIPRQDGVEYDVSFALFEGAGENGADIPIALLIHNVNDPNFEVDILDLRKHEAPYSLEEGVCIAKGSTPEDDPQVRLGLRIDGIEMYRDYVALSYRRDGLPHLAVMTKKQAATDFLEGKRWDFTQVNPGHGLGGSEPDDKLFSIGSTGNPSYEAPRLRYAFGSYTQPTQLHELDPATGEDVLLKRATVLGGFDEDDYAERRLWVTASDGTHIPVSLVWRKDRVAFDAEGEKPNEPLPMFITGYGAYEISSDPGFSVGRLSMLDRGVLYAVAHIRGGGEMGREWYEEGKELNKRNSFTDFVEVTRWLERSGWADVSRTVANGGSAGGLLMGAVINMAPDAFAGVEADVPFVDALTSILDPSLPLTVTEWDEWGDPLHDDAVYRYMKSYSPYENVMTADERAHKFGTDAMPKIFATTSLNDTRVLYVEPMKWIARLQEPEVGADAIVKVEVDPSGHGGVSGRYKQWDELAYENAWCLSVMGITE